MCSEGLVERYVNFYTDFAFKKIFGTEANKDLLISFLNALLDLKEGNLITDLTYLNAEQLGATNDDRRAIYDVYCKNQRDERFIVEMQKTEQLYFRDRSLYYSTFPIQDEAVKGYQYHGKDVSELPTKWNYKLNPIYVIGILDFVLKKHKQKKIITNVTLKDDEDEVFNENLNFIYLEMPKFNKKENELETLLDKWLYAIKFLSTLDKRPAIFKERVFKRLFEIAEIAKYNKKELNEYRVSQKILRDYDSIIDSAYVKGEIKGIQQEKLKNAKAMKDEGLNINLISKITGLSIEEIEKL